MANQNKRNIPVADQNFAHVLPGPSNEEIAAEHERRKQEDPFYARVQMGTDAKDKALDGFGDIEFDPLGLSDPLLAMKNQYAKPGMALKLLSPRVMNTLGPRGYQIVKQENGDPVTSGNMVLGEIPEKYAKARQRAVSQRTNEEMQSLKARQAEGVERAQRDAKGGGIGVVDRGSIRDHDTGRDYDMGMVVERGELRDA
jgi:hypothetical protein